MASLYISIFLFKKFEKIEKIGYHSNFDFECNTERGFKVTFYSSGVQLKFNHITVLTSRLWCKNLAKLKVLSLLLYGICDALKCFEKIRSHPGLQEKSSLIFLGDWSGYPHTLCS